MRDVIRSCIYGVDLNPLAVELCKVALWLEAHIPGDPLHFLDHRIKCGNAIVGLARQEELGRGISDEAFKTLLGDDKEVAAALRSKTRQSARASKNFPGATLARTTSTPCSQNWQRSLPSQRPPRGNPPQTTTLRHLREQCSTPQPQDPS